MVYSIYIQTNKERDTMFNYTDEEIEEMTSEEIEDLLADMWEPQD